MPAQPRFDRAVAKNAAAAKAKPATVAPAHTVATPARATPSAEAEVAAHVARKPSFPVGGRSYSNIGNGAQTEGNAEGKHHAKCTTVGRVDEAAREGDTLEAREREEEIGGISKPWRESGQRKGVRRAAGEASCESTDLYAAEGSPKVATCVERGSRVQERGGRSKANATRRLEVDGADEDGGSVSPTGKPPPRGSNIEKRRAAVDSSVGQRQDEQRQQKDEYQQKVARRIQMHVREDRGDSDDPHEDVTGAESKADQYVAVMDDLDVAESAGVPSPTVERRKAPVHTHSPGIINTGDAKVTVPTAGVLGPGTADIAGKYRREEASPTVERTACFTGASAATRRAAAAAALNGLRLRGRIPPIRSGGGRMSPSAPSTASVSSSMGEQYGSSFEEDTEGSSVCSGGGSGCRGGLGCGSTAPATTMPGGFPVTTTTMVGSEGRHKRSEVLTPGSVGTATTATPSTGCASSARRRRLSPISGGGGGSVRTHASVRRDGDGSGSRGYSGIGKGEDTISVSSNMSVGSVTSSCESSSMSTPRSTRRREYFASAATPSSMLAEREFGNAARGFTASTVTTGTTLTFGSTADNNESSFERASSSSWTLSSEVSAIRASRDRTQCDVARGEYGAANARGIHEDGDRHTCADIVADGIVTPRSEGPAQDMERSIASQQANGNCGSGETGRSCSLPRAANDKPAAMYGVGLQDGSIAGGSEGTSDRKRVGGLSSSSPSSSSPSSSSALEDAGSAEAVCGVRELLLHASDAQVRMGEETRRLIAKNDVGAVGLAVFLDLPQVRLL